MKSKAKKAAAADGISLRPKELVNKTKTMLTPLLNSTVREIESEGPGCKIWQFYIDEMPAEEDRPGARLLPLDIRGGPDDLWFSVRFDLSQSGLYLWHAQMRFIVGSATAPNKTCFLRLEWDPRVNAQRHAQPHWQIEGVDVARDRGSFKDYSEEARRVVLDRAPDERPTEEWASDNYPPDDRRRPNRDYWYGVERMHLPMASTFQRDRGTQGIAPGIGTADDIVRWVKGSYLYIKDQLAYLERRGIMPK